MPVKSRPSSQSFLSRSINTKPASSTSLDTLTHSFILTLWHSNTISHRLYVFYCVLHGWWLIMLASGRKTFDCLFKEPAQSRRNEFVQSKQTLSREHKCIFILINSTFFNICSYDVDSEQNISFPSWAFNQICCGVRRHLGLSVRLHPSSLQYTVHCISIHPLHISTYWTIIYLLTYVGHLKL